MSINAKYFQDIKKFPEQFDAGVKTAEQVDLTGFEAGSYQRIVLCGVGGSSLYAELVNQMLGKKIIFPHNGYDLPRDVSKTDLIICASHSGNTEETISSVEAAAAAGHRVIAFTSGGKLMEMAKAATTPVPVFTLPTGIQPRLTTGYFIAFCIYLINKLGFSQVDMEEISVAFKHLEGAVDEPKAQQIAKSLVGKTAIIYADDKNWSIARIVKIKFNENAKVQAFWNFFPEMNHNEMVGFTKVTSNPSFLILKSKFAHPRIHTRIDVFAKLMRSKNLSVEVIDLAGGSITEEMLHAYFLADHITYYLAQEYGIDPEPVDMVEEFKKML